MAGKDGQHIALVSEPKRLCCFRATALLPTLAVHMKCQALIGLWGLNPDLENCHRMGCPSVHILVSQLWVKVGQGVRVPGIYGKAQTHVSVDMRGT